MTTCKIRHPLYSAAIVFVVAMLSFLLPGCGGKESGEESNEMILQHALNSKIKCFDPVNIQDEYSLMVCSQIFETLYQYHYLKRPYQLVPLLADGMPQVSEDKLTYTVRIKKVFTFRMMSAFRGVMEEN